MIHSDISQTETLRIMRIRSCDLQSVKRVPGLEMELCKVFSNFTASIDD